MTEQFLVALRLVLGLNIMTGQKMVSRTMKVIAPLSETKYDEGSMVNGYEGRVRGRDGIVLCTTEIGPE